RRRDDRGYWCSLKVEWASSPVQSLRGQNARATEFKHYQYPAAAQPRIRTSISGVNDPNILSWRGDVDVCFVRGWQLAIARKR
ncbi:MAG: hypothetical protein L0Y44_16440, partial [Phycisphaerales bacterium]|nr:hypothetical protein [Phycisphaerales bacterium]